MSNSADNPEFELVPFPRVMLLAPRVGPTTTGMVIATTPVGKPVSLTAQVTAHAWNRVVRAILAVVVPGSVAGGFPWDPESAMNPARRIAEGQPLLGFTAGTAEVSMSFQATEPGTYPVFYLDEFVQAASRRLPPRIESGGRLRYGCAPLGDIIIK